MEKLKNEEQFTFMTTDDFGKKARSKKDLHYLFTHQRNNKANYYLVNWVLPIFKEWIVSFLKGILAEENEVSFIQDGNDR